MMLRVFHQSSHLGERVLLRTRTERINLSYQSVDLKLSTSSANLLRLYAGGGYLFGQDPSTSAPVGPVRRGAHEPLPSAHRAGGRSRLSTSSSTRENDWSPTSRPRRHRDRRRAAHPQASSSCSIYSTGHSPNGQFYKDRVQKYLGLGAHFHF